MRPRPVGLRQLLPVPRLRLLRSVPRLRDRDPVPVPAAGACTAGSAAPARLPPPMLRDDRRVAAEPVGAARLVVQGVGFIGAGLIISAIGVTHVFVHEDLEFMRTTRQALAAAQAAPGAAGRARPRHARRHAAGQRAGDPADEPVGLPAAASAGCGGRCSCAGAARLRRGDRRPLRRRLPQPFHLAPAFVGLALFAAALAASWPSLGRRPTAYAFGCDFL